MTRCISHRRIVLDAVAAELFANAGITPSAAQTAIDRDLKPQSRPLPDTTLTLHLRNSSERTGVTNNVAGLLPGSDPRLAPETILIRHTTITMAWLRAPTPRIRRPAHPLTHIRARRYGMAPMTTVRAP